MSCIVCQKEDFRRYLKGLKQCKVCSHVASDLDVNTLSFRDIYDRAYFNGKEYYNYIDDRECLEKNFYQRLKDIRRWCPCGNLLEIGSAYGFFLSLAQKHFKVTGYEICQDALDYAKKEFSLDIRSGDFLSKNHSDEKFDAVVMWDVLEHLPHPENTLDEIYNSLKTGGILALTTGDISSFFARVCGKKWRLIHTPTHLHYFTKASLLTLLRRHNFEIVNMSYPGYWRSLGQIFYSLFVFGDRPKPAIFNWVHKTRLARLAIYTNTFDILQVIAKKR